MQVLKNVSRAWQTRLHDCADGRLSPGTEEGAPLRQAHQQRQHFQGRDLAQRCAAALRGRVAGGVRWPGQAGNGTSGGIRGTHPSGYKRGRESSPEASRKGQITMTYANLSPLANHLWQSTI